MPSPRSKIMRTMSKIVQNKDKKDKLSKQERFDLQKQKDQAEKLTKPKSPRRFFLFKKRPSLSSKTKLFPSPRDNSSVGRVQLKAPAKVQEKASASPPVKQRGVAYTVTQSQVPVARRTVSQLELTKSMERPPSLPDLGHSPSRGSKTPPGKSAAPKRAGPAPWQLLEEAIEDLYDDKASSTPENGSNALEVQGTVVETRPAQDGEDENNEVEVEIII